ncbi:MAG TPA: ATP synthase F0 subunit B [Pyrinomonadaceae bacterium]|jgi:ATP synthase F0 subunit b|nr:ATP synthase F0 subunit B [Pyrinomonadaceae bacterium]
MMIALIKFSTLLALQEAAVASDGPPWWNYPGFELWKFINLFLFVGVLVYILRRPLGDALRTRRETIRRELMRAQEERNAALAKLEEVEARLARLDAEVASVREHAEKEAVEERERVKRSTEDDARKLREQAQREIESAGKAARQELREYAAEQSVRLAEEMIRRDIRPDDDARLVNLNVEELGGMRR